MPLPKSAILFDDAVRATEIGCAVTSILRNRGNNDMVLVVGDDVFIENHMQFDALEAEYGRCKTSLCQTINALHAKFVPLASYGELAGGEKSRMKIATKCGMAGDKNALIACIDSLKNKLSEALV